MHAPTLRRHARAITSTMMVHRRARPTVIMPQWRIIICTTTHTSRCIRRARNSRIVTARRWATVVSRPYRRMSMFPMRMHSIIMCRRRCRHGGAKRKNWMPCIWHRSDRHPTHQRYAISISLSTLMHCVLMHMYDNRILFIISLVLQLPPRDMSPPPLPPRLGLIHNAIKKSSGSNINNKDEVLREHNLKLPNTSTIMMRRNSAMERASKDGTTVTATSGTSILQSASSLDSPGPKTPLDNPVKKHRQSAPVAPPINRRAR